MEAAVVVSASRGALGVLLGKLSNLLVGKYKLLKGVRGEIMFLKAELESMYAFLERMSDAEEEPDQQAKCWMEQVRELSYNIEDSVDEFMLCIDREPNSKPRGFRGFIEKSMDFLTKINTRHRISKEFQGLKSSVMEVSERRMRYKVDDIVTKPSHTAIDLRLLSLYAETMGLVGIDGPRDELIQLIMDEDSVTAQQLKVLSVVGFGGLGKTTLAKAMYRKLEGQFQHRAILSVSQKPNIRKIFRNILSQVGFVAPEHTNMETWGDDEVIITLQNFLTGKRYFIVIDDIWDETAWNIIRCARLRMEKVWNLPKEEDLRETGPEWALNILANQDDSMRCKILFLWWRAWHLRNNSIFGDGKAMIDDSACFIENYYNTTMQLNFGMPTPDRKGKCLLSPVAASRNEKDRRTTTQKWTKPPLGWAKINTDASFISANGAAHWGAIVRDDQGNTISSAWSPIPRCSTVEEAEAIAVLEGLRLASTVDTPCCLETDCKSVTDAWNWDTIKRSQAGIVINEAKHAALSFQNLKIEFIPRSANGAAHRLAAFSRSTGCNGVLYGSVPECVLDQVLSDCNQNNIL